MKLKFLTVSTGQHLSNNALNKKMTTVTLYNTNNCFIGKHFESSTTSLSQVFGMEHGGCPRKRTAYCRFTEYQLSEMKKRFKSDPHIKGIEKQLMAKNLGISMTALADWFKAQRKLERKLANEVSNATIVTC